MAFSALNDAPNFFFIWQYMSLMAELGEGPPPKATSTVSAPPPPQRQPFVSPPPMVSSASPNDTCILY